jgi:hypothetical protein
MPQICSPVSRGVRLKGQVSAQSTCSKPIGEFQMKCDLPEGGGRGGFPFERIYMPQLRSPKTDGSVLVIS